WWGQRRCACWVRTRRPSASCPTRTARRATRGVTASPPELGQHLVRQDAQRPDHAVHGEQAAGIQLDDEAVEPQVGLEPAEPLDEARRRPERHALLENLVVVHGLELREPRLVPVERAGVVAAEPRARELLVALEEVRDVLAGLVERFLFGRRRIHGNTQ